MTDRRHGAAPFCSATTPSSFSASLRDAGARRTEGVEERQLLAPYLVSRARTPQSSSRHGRQTSVAPGRNREAKTFRISSRRWIAKVSSCSDNSDLARYNWYDVFKGCTVLGRPVQVEMAHWDGSFCCCARLTR